MTWRHFHGVSGGTLSVPGGMSTVSKSAGLTISMYLPTAAIVFIEASMFSSRERARRRGVQIFGSGASLRSRLKCCYAKFAPDALHRIMLRIAGAKRAFESQSGSVAAADVQSAQMHHV
jgi:hypothetical protein